MIHRFFISVACVLLTTLPFFTQAQQSDSLAVKVSVEKFLQSFNSLQWESFRKSFTEDATIFFPDWEQASRKAGTREVEETWLKIFPEFKDPTITLKLDITPRNMMIQLYGSTAIVTFQLGSGEKYLSRRTLVMIKKDGGWKIAHLHASTLSPEDK